MALGPTCCRPQHLDSLPPPLARTRAEPWRFRRETRELVSGNRSGSGLVDVGGAKNIQQRLGNWMKLLQNGYDDMKMVHVRDGEELMLLLKLSGLQQPSLTMAVTVETSQSRLQQLDLPQCFSFISQTGKKWQDWSFCALGAFGTCFWTCCRHTCEAPITLGCCGVLPSQKLRWQVPWSIAPTSTDITDLKAAEKSTWYSHG